MHFSFVTPNLLQHKHFNSFNWAGNSWTFTGCEGCNHPLMIVKYFNKGFISCILLLLLFLSFSSGSFWSKLEMPKVWTLGCTSECNFHSISLSPRPEPLPWPVTTPSTIIPCLARYYTIIQLAPRTQRRTNSRNRNSNFADDPKIQFNPTYTYLSYALWGSQCERNQALNSFSEAQGVNWDESL